MPPAPSTSGSTIKAAARLDDQGCGSSIAGHSLETIQRLLLVPRGRKGDDVDLEQQGFIGGVEHATRTDAHRSNRVTMIAVLHDDDARARRADVAEITERHLQRDFD
ncbi:hypothetical protein X767_33395 [Mesorhizobium sp. LSJC264A00]|nr:hypothetical protein X767_33395 [Mesorhizobium sp. LSJC264A00]